MDLALPMDESYEPRASCTPNGRTVVGAIFVALALLGVFDLVLAFLSPGLFSTVALFLTVIGLFDCILQMSLISRLSDPVESLISVALFKSAWFTWLWMFCPFLLYLILFLFYLKKIAWILDCVVAVDAGFL